MAALDRAAQRRAVVLELFRAALRAAEPRAAIRRHLRRDGQRLTADGREYDLASFNRVLIAGAGKAGAAMAQELEDIVGDRLTAGVVIVKEGYIAPTRRVKIVEASHPVPSQAGVTATSSLLDLVSTAGPDDLILCPISGGGSALLVAPAPPLTLEEKQALTDLLLRAGCTINEINAVRKHCSAVKGGQLARAANGATILTLLLSDVVGNPLDVIASGPTVPDPTTYADALAVLDRYRLRQQAPRRVISRLEAGVRSELPETPKPGDSCFAHSQAIVVAGIGQSCTAAAVEARQRGYLPQVLTSYLQGEAREVARVLVAVGRSVLADGQPISPPACLIAGGETTVTVRGDGKGGRDQELALAAALALDGLEQLTVGALATDGGDGPTDAAGAIVDFTTPEAIARTGRSAEAGLQRNDAYSVLDAAGALVRTGPTGTNVNDLIVVIVDKV